MFSCKFSLSFFYHLQHANPHRFEAAWNGDLDTIKKLTLSAWGDDKDKKPLAVAVNDLQGNNAFSLAFLRGHHNVATAVLEIAQAQYAPEDKPKVRYELKDDRVDEDTDMDSEYEYDEEEDESRTYRIIVDNDQFTIDNIGEVNMQVKGTVVSNIPSLIILTFLTDTVYRPLSNCWLRMPRLSSSAMARLRSTRPSVARFSNSSLDRTTRTVSSSCSILPRILLPRRQMPRTAAATTTSRSASSAPPLPAAVSRCWPRLSSAPVLVCPSRRWSRTRASLLRSHPSTTRA